jgi:glycosyltransferase involved in cell wall biosynthesis
VGQGQELVLADDPAEFAQATLDLLENPLRRSELGPAGQAFAHANYGWDTLVPQLERVYEAGLKEINR